MLRTFEETTQRQNAENAKLRKQLLAYKEKEAQLSDRVQELEELTTALTSNTGRNPTDKTEHTNNTGRNPTDKTEHTASTYSPHVAIPSSPLGLTPRVPRPQDVAYQAALNQKQAETTKAGEKLTAELNTETGVLKLFSKLAQALTDNNNTDVSSPPHFSGKDDEWETWYSQFRTYLKAKGWLDTFESQGPHTAGFNPDLNAKIYNKLIILCGKGYALTYVQNAAEFDGVGAGRQLLARYDGFSRQRNRSLRKTIEQLKHTSGTSMSDHIDLFEKICGQIASSGQPATEEEKLDWFLESVHEDTYHAIKHTATA
jgi:hypothetical protein